MTREKIGLFLIAVYAWLYQLGFVAPEAVLQHNRRDDTVVLHVTGQLHQHLVDITTTPSRTVEACRSCFVTMILQAISEEEEA